jgi:hypothetical protein
VELSIVGIIQKPYSIVGVIHRPEHVESVQWEFLSGCNKWSFIIHWPEQVEFSIMEIILGL